MSLCYGFICRWLDKLGLAARLGLDVVMRQVLVGNGSYHLVDDNLDPLPVRLQSLCDYTLMPCENSTLIFNALVPREPEYKLSTQHIS